MYIFKIHSIFGLKTKETFLEMKKEIENHQILGTEFFGTTENGKNVFSVALKNSSGMSLKVLEYGATLQSLKIELESGKWLDLVLGFENLYQYIQSFSLPSASYFGATIGRFAGRIKEGKYKLNNQLISLNTNNNNNCLHGGFEGFSQKIWKIEAVNFKENPFVRLGYTSPDGEEGFPGNLQISTTYTLTESNELIIEHQAVAEEDTIINLTHHSYFNLEGQNKNVVNQSLEINSSEVLEILEMIPTGNFLKTENTIFDFSQLKNCPETIDCTFVLDKNKTPAATLFCQKNNLKMQVFTNQAALHVYVGGNCFDQIKGKENTAYHSQSGICFETQNFPDAPNHEHFPTAILKKGETYFHQTIYQFQTHSL